MEVDLFSSIRRGWTIYLDLFSQTWALSIKVIKIGDGHWHNPIKCKFHHRLNKGQHKKVRNIDELKNNIDTFLNFCIGNSFGLPFSRAVKPQTCSFSVRVCRMPMMGILFTNLLLHKPNLLYNFKNKTNKLKIY
jgi:hypothetical protein